MTIATWLSEAKVQLTEAGIPSAPLDSELLLSYALEKDRTWLLAHNEEVLLKAAEEKTNSLLARRLKREPLAYIRGWQEFYGRRFHVTPDVLIPRPESETIIELLKQLSAPLSGTLIDVGTGSGALGITIQKEFPKLQVALSDISPAALKVAERNSQELQAKISLVQSDLLQATPHADIIVANLPYVDPTWQRSPETQFEPALALFAKDAGLELIFRLIEQAASAKLASHGFLFLEADPRQSLDIKTFAAKRGFTFVRSEGFILQFQKY